jgi:hypothetical protein
MTSMDSLHSWLGWILLVLLGILLVAIMVMLFSMLTPSVPGHKYPLLPDNPALARRLVRAATPLIPTVHRARYKAEWLAELEFLKQEGQEESSQLRVAVRITLTAPHMALILRRHAVAQWLRQLEPLWVGFFTAIATAAGITAGLILPNGSRPTQVQLSLMITASVLMGGLATFKSRRDQVVRQRDVEHNREDSD